MLFESEASGPFGWEWGKGGCVCVSHGFLFPVECVPLPWELLTKAAATACGRGWRPVPLAFTQPRRGTGASSRPHTESLELLLRSLIQSAQGGVAGGRTSSPQLLRGSMTHATAIRRLLAWRCGDGERDGEEGCQGKTCPPPLGYPKKDQVVQSRKG